VNRRIESFPTEIPTPSHEAGWRDTVGRVAVGVGLAGGALAGTGLAVTGNLPSLDNKIAITSDDARPSDDLANLFDLMIQGGTIAGAAFVGARGAHHIRAGLDPHYRALSEIAHAQPPTSIPRRIGAVGLLGTGTAAMAGSFMGIADGVAHSQENIASAATSIMQDIGGDGEVYMITNSPHPELSSNGNVPRERAETIVQQAAADSIPAIPMRWEWHTGWPSDETEDAKRTIVAVSLPNEITDLPPASESCEDISVTAARQLGVEVGDSITMEGLTLQVRSVLTEEAGVNLLPVIFNNDDFARCVDKDPDLQQPFSAILTKGEKDQVEATLEKAGVSSNNLSQNLFVVPETEFTDNTLQTGKNSVNGLVLQAMATAMVLGGAALSNQSKAELTASREPNTVLRVGGFTDRQVRRIHTEKAASDTAKSTLLSGPIIVAIDAFSNFGLPGSAMGVTGGTLLAVLGLTAGAKIGGTLLANRSERGKLEIGGREL